MGRSKLTEQDKNEIRQMRSSGVTWVKIASKFEVSTSTIARVLNPQKYSKDLKKSVQYQKEHGKRIYKHNKERTRSFRIVVNKTTDADVITKLDSVENVNEYVRELVLKDINKGSE